MQRSKNANRFHQDNFREKVQTRFKLNDNSNNKNDYKNDSKIMNETIF